MTGSVILPPGYSLLHVAETTSTNQLALDSLETGDAGDRLVVWADSQTAGRGRQGRTWESPAGNLFASIVLFPDTPLERAAQLGFAAALGVAEAVRGWMPAPDAPAIACKWPNDVLIGGRKCAGILLEAAKAGSGAQAIVVGIGINLVEKPLAARFPATSLADEWGVIVPLPTALAALLGRFEHWVRTWQETGFAPIRDAWQATAHKIGDPIGVRLANSQQSGMFAGIDDTGALRLETPDGVRIITAGDVYFAEQQV